MKLFEANTEIQVIRTICDSQERFAVLGRVNAEFFGSDECKEIFLRISTLIGAGKPAPTSLVLQNDQALSESSRALLSNTQSPVLVDDNLEVALEILNKHRKARILSKMVVETVEKMKSDDPDVDSVVSALESTLAACHTGSSQRSEMLHISADNVDELVKSVEADLDSPVDDIIPTGFREFDTRTGGFRKKNVITIASVSGGGKTAMMCQMALNQYLMGFNVCIVSYEMDHIELKYRILSNVSQVFHSNITLKRLSPEQRAIVLKKWANFIRGSGLKNRLTIWCPERSLNIPEISMEIKPLGYDICYVDYLSLLRDDPKKAMWETLGDHARSAKLCANNLNMAYVLLAQYDSAENKIKYSAAITNNSSFVWAWDVKPEDREAGRIQVQQLKARSAEVYNFDLQRNMATMQFCDINTLPLINPSMLPMNSAKGVGQLPKMPELG